MFLQVPFPQGCLSHSSTSETKSFVTVPAQRVASRGRIKRRGLTNTHGLVPRHFKAVGADAAITAQGVYALTWVTDPRVLSAFVTI